MLGRKLGSGQMRLLARSPNLDHAECAIGLLQLRVLCFGFLQDGNVGVGVFPEREEILVCGFHRGDVTGLMRQCTDGSFTTTPG